MVESTNTDYSALAQSVKFLKGVGENRARLLGKMGIRTILDLLEYFPKAYINRKLNPSLIDVQPGDILAFTAMISWVDIRQTNKGKQILNVGVSDSKVAMVCSWFSYRKNFEQQFIPGRLVWLSGTLSEFNGQFQMVHPEVEFLEEDDESGGDFWKKRAVLPVYSLTEGITQKLMRRLIFYAFSLYANQLEEKLPPAILEKHGFVERRIALQKMHFGQNEDEIQKVRQRFAYEDLFFSQILWARHKAFHTAKTEGICFVNEKLHTRSLYAKLPFQLTSAQKQALREIFADMCSEKQMSRLLQGDVGSGKTVVAVFAMLLAVENRYQAALMAPTEILADQHYNTISGLLSGLEVQVCLLKGGVYKGKTETKEDIATGKAQIVIGTHALLQKDVQFAKLGFVCVDEQHRFGVEQRAKLAKMALHPDLLYLSATPIPRSLAMTVYGDLEVSIVNEMPPSRKPVQTLIRSSAKIELVYTQVRKELLAGHQVYIVCPLVELSEKLSLIDATQLYELIAKKVYPEFSTALLHGRMTAREKDEIMGRFKSGDIKILVSTTVIEVGVDVPNASVMIVEHAERFGLAQLHQLRGRVGRGTAQSFCYLVEHQPVGRIARARLDTMARTTDGFLIAEKDLELRGPGEFFGYEQSGMPQFKFANIMRDQELLKIARFDAFGIVQNDPEFAATENENLKKLYRLQYATKEQLILY